MEVCGHFGRNNSGECGFAKTGRTGEQQMVRCLTAAPRSLKHDAQVLFEFSLTDKVRQRPRS
jgi:hypothetical protein